MSKKNNITSGGVMMLEEIKRKAEWLVIFGFISLCFAGLAGVMKLMDLIPGMNYGQPITCWGVNLIDIFWMFGLVVAFQLGVTGLIFLLIVYLIEKIKNNLGKNMEVM